MKHSKSLRSVFGFSLVKPSGTEATKINTDLHKLPEKCRSNSLSLRQILHDVFRADKVIAGLIDILEDADELEGLPFSSVYLNIGDELQQLERFPVWPLLDEKRVFDDFSMNLNGVKFERRVAVAIQEEGTISIKYIGDGFARSFPII